MRTDFVNHHILSKKGRNFLRLEDQKRLDAANKSFDEITLDIVNPSEIDKFEVEKILEEFWSSVSQPDKSLLVTYNTPRKRKKLLYVINTKFDNVRISTSPVLKDVLALFHNDHSEILLNRWMSILMHGWEDIVLAKDNFEKITNFIRSKLNRSNKRFERTKYLDKNRKVFLKAKGPQYFAEETIGLGLTHVAMCQLIGLKFEPSSYHSLVNEELFTYHLKTKQFQKASEFISGILESPSQYSVRTKKKLVSLFIVAVERNDLNEHLDLAKTAGFDRNIIGDPANIASWTVWTGGNTQDTERMERAREILNKWLLSSFVEVFFHLLIDDPKRKAYWLEKISMVNSVKVYGTGEAKYKLERDQRIKPFINPSRFIQVLDTGTTSGIMMSIGKHNIIEFTDSGALYCYLKDGNWIPLKVNYLSQLKHPSIRLASSPGQSNSDSVKWLNGRNIYLNQEGRIVHNPQDGNVQNGKLLIKDGWMKRTDLWLKTYAI